MTAPNHIVGGITLTGICGGFVGINVLESPWYLAMIVFAAQLPDIDHTKSVIGRIPGLTWISYWLNRKYGHRTITHSLIPLSIITSNMGHFITSKDIPADGEHIESGKLSLPIMATGAVAVVGLLLSAWLLFAGNEANNEAADTVAGRYAYSWLFAFAFFVSFSLGGAFWLLLHHVSNSGWGISVRRLMENLACVFPWMGVIAIPFLFPQVQQHLSGALSRKSCAFGFPYQ